MSAIILPFRPRSAPGVQPVPADRLAVEALQLVQYLRDVLAVEPGIRKRARARLHELADESAELLQHALECRGLRP